MERATAPLTVESLARARGLPVAFLRDELGLADGPRGVVIPYYDEAGEHFRSRLRSAHQAKKGSSWLAGKGMIPYGLWRLDQARKAGWMAVVEGETDSWVLWHGGFPAIGLPGSGTAGLIQAEHL